MNSFTYITIIVFCTSLAIPPSWSVAEKQITETTSTGGRSIVRDRHFLVKGELAAVYVEKALYEKEDEPHFYVRVRVKNLSERAIGVDLRDYSKVIYPNQWGVHLNPVRGVINERRMIPDTIDNELKSKLIAAFKNKELTIIEPHKSVEYFREFNASGRKDVDEKEGKYFILSMDGQLLVTDGKAVENVNLCRSRDKISPENTDLVIPLPIPWKMIPRAALIIERKP